VPDLPVISALSVPVSVMVSAGSPPSLIDCFSLFSMFRPVSAESLPSLSPHVLHELCHDMRFHNSFAASSRCLYP